MREHKYMVWDIVEKRWVKPVCDEGNKEVGFCIRLDGVLIEYTNTQFYPSVEYPEMDRYKIVEYIGRKDMNGREVYEGCFFKSNDIYHIVMWEDYKWVVASIDEMGYHNELDMIDGIEILGHILEHPELLEGVDWLCPEWRMGGGE